jgi:Tol biopolymer transport system component
LIAPTGQQVAVSLFGSGGAETGPALAVYSTGATAATTFLNLATENARPLAWSPDGRYLAIDVQSTAASGASAKSGLAIVDVALGKVTMIATGSIYGASFAPTGPNALVYGGSGSESPFARVNLYEFTNLSNGVGGQPVSGRGEALLPRALTGDGRSLFPVWGRRGIAFDRERLRGNNAPQYQIWLRSPTGSSARRLTDVRAGNLVSGLVPIAFSRDGTRLLAEFEGQDTSEAWTVRLTGGHPRRVTVRGRSVQGAGISADGRTLLVETGAMEAPASAGRVSTVPFAGGRATVVVAHGSQASWTAG